MLIDRLGWPRAKESIGGHADLRDHPQKLVMRSLSHEGQRDQKSNECRKDLGGLNERLLLDLRKGLEQRDGDANDGTDDQQGCRNHDNRDDGIVRSAHHFETGHEECPCCLGCALRQW